MAWYARDCLAWIDDWVWTYDPRARGRAPKRMPMILWGKQREMVTFVLSCLDARDNGLIKKARDVGATWIMAAVAVWLFLFEPEAAIAFGSRKQDLVDKSGDPKTIFSKIRDILDALPVWMLPRGYNPTRHDNFLMLLNPHNGSTITGEAGDEMGRGGRSTIYFLDEFAFVPRASTVDAAVNDNAGTVIYLSTSNGVGTLFYDKEKQARIPILRHYWYHDPRKDEAWKAKKIEKVGPTIFAQEHELDDGAALDNVVIPPAWVLAAVRIKLEPGSTVVCGLDVADAGTDLNVLVTRRGGVVDPLDVWRQVRDEHTGEMRDALPSDSGERALAHARAIGAALNYDRVGIGAGVAGVVEGQLAAGVRGIIGGAKPTQTVYDDDPRKPASERFANLITELWWSLRRRFQRTWEHSQGIATYPVDELISLPDDSTLIAQLSSRLYETTETGKIRVESKKKLKSRGVKSPDHADGLVYAFAPPIQEVPKMTARAYTRGGRRSR